MMDKFPFRIMKIWFVQFIVMLNKNKFDFYIIKLLKINKNALFYS